MKKIIVYDFDKTLTYKDTLFGFFRYATKKDFKYIFKVVFYFLCMIFTKLGLISNFRQKDIGLKLFCSNVEPEILNHKIKTYYKYIKYNTLYKELNFNSVHNYYVISASLSEYIYPAFPDHVNILGSSIKYVNNRVIGLETNCYKSNKLFQLKKEGISEIDILYTDSYSDYSLASIAKKVIIVDKDNIIVCNHINEFKGYFRK